MRIFARATETTNAQHATQKLHTIDTTKADHFYEVNEKYITTFFHDYDQQPDLEYTDVLSPVVWQVHHQ